MFCGMLYILPDVLLNLMEGGLQSPMHDTSIPLPYEDVFQDPKAPVAASAPFLQTMESRSNIINLIPAEEFFISKPDIKASQMKMPCGLRV